MFIITIKGTKYREFTLFLQKNKEYAKQESICLQGQATREEEVHGQACGKIEARESEQPVE